MTGRETLRMFAKLRGVPHDRIDNVVTDLLDRLTLTPHADKTSESYSGGNKRKLSLGIAALVGDGGVLLIDECSSGLDPLARKKLWGLIEQLAENRSVIITTHSMEEAGTSDSDLIYSMITASLGTNFWLSISSEALCSRIGIMARGQFAALGSVQHLKTKYLDGYTIDINCRSNIPEDVIDIVVADVLETVVPGSKLAERHGRFLKFDVSRVSTIGLGTTFARLQKLKESGDSVENYSISQW
jgi:ATP-binding cassette subfamily A (ABC1) protein 3